MTNKKTSKVLSTLADLPELTSTAVVIDVFRSSNTIIECLAKGAREIIPVESENRARQLKKQHPEWLLFGERDGKMLPGFDGDNSPALIRDDISGKSIIITTSGGTRCIEACRHCRHTFIGSYANASYLINHLQISLLDDVSFWAVGRKAESVAFEDESCARYLADCLNGNENLFDQFLPDLLSCEGAERLRQRGQGADLEYCLQLNIRNTIPICVTIEDQVRIVDCAKPSGTG